MFRPGHYGYGFSSKIEKNFLNVIRGLFHKFLCDGFLNDMNILITGSSGFVGKQVINAFNEIFANVTLHLVLDLKKKI